MSDRPTMARDPQNNGCGGPKNGKNKSRHARRSRVAAFALIAFICCLPAACTPGKHAEAGPAVTEPVKMTVAPALTLPPTPVPTPTPIPTPDPATEPFTIAWFGDTQSYASTYPERFNAMAQWVLDNREAYNIRYVVHTGDIVNQPEVEQEWAHAREALGRLTGVLPFFSVAGNHDIVGMLNQTGEDYGPYAALMEELRCADTETLAYHDDTWRKRYDLLTVGGEEFIFLGIGYRLALADYDWLNEVLLKYADRTAVLIVHRYLDFDGVPREDGRHLFRKVVMQNANVKYVLCGHRHRVLHSVQEVDADFDRKIERNVYAFMNDYQGLPDGGGAYIVLMTFDPKLREIRMTSYSPVRDDFNYYDDETVETYTLPYL